MVQKFSQLQGRTLCLPEPSTASSPPGNFPHSKGIDCRGRKALAADLLLCGEIYPVNPSSSVFFLWRWFSNVLLLQKLKRRLPHHHCFLVQQINRQRKQAPRLICRPPLIGSSGKLLYNHLPPSSPRSMETKRNYIVCVSVCHPMTHGSPR